MEVAIPLPLMVDVKNQNGIDWNLHSNRLYDVPNWGSEGEKVERFCQVRLLKLNARDIWLVLRQNLGGQWGHEERKGTQNVCVPFKLRGPSFISDLIWVNSPRTRSSDMLCVALNAFHASWLDSCGSRKESQWSLTCYIYARLAAMSRIRNSDSQDMVLSSHCQWNGKMAYPIRVRRRDEKAMTSPSPLILYPTIRVEGTPCVTYLIHYTAVFTHSGNGVGENIPIGFESRSKMIGEFHRFFSTTKTWWKNNGREGRYSTFSFLHPCSTFSITHKD